VAERDKLASEALASAGGDLLVPGLGALLGPAIGFGFQQGQEEKLRKALIAAMCVEQPSHGRWHVIKRSGAAFRSRKLKKTARRALEDENLRKKLLQANRKSGTASATKSKRPIPVAVGIRVRAEEFLSASGPMDRPTDWREAVAQMIQTSASAGLANAYVNSAKATGEDKAANSWRELIAPGQNRDPRPSQIEDYSRLVARSFEIELAQSQQQAWLQRLDEENRLATSYAQLDLLDGARRLLWVVAAALVFLAAEYGIHLIT
jgi:hypothetical protein